MKEWLEEGKKERMDERTDGRANKRTDRPGTENKGTLTARTSILVKQYMKGRLLVERTQPFVEFVKSDHKKRAKR